jgi:hypothetical protein
VKSDKHGPIDFKAKAKAPIDIVVRRHRPGRERDHRAGGGRVPQ